MNEAAQLIARRKQLDKELRAWGNATQKKMLFLLNGMGLRDRERLAGEVSLKKSLKSKTRKRDGAIEAVAFSFSRSGIFIEHGVGRGRPRGSSLAEKYKKPWLSEVLPTEIERLADILAEEYADVTEEEIKVNIPGINFKTK